MQKKSTTDKLRIVRTALDEPYDIIFAVMQHQQMSEILEELACADSPKLVLVGNNLSAAEMKRTILEKSPVPKTVLFGFQSTAGSWEEDHFESVHLGAGEFYLGGLHRDATKEEKAFFEQLFSNTTFQIKWQDDMDGWYKSHLAFILPVAYLCYATDCNLYSSSKQQRKQLLDATNECYALLKALDVPIRPSGEETYYRPGIKRLFCVFIVFLMAKTKLGALCASDHCRHAVSEMASLDQKWLELRDTLPDFKMPNFDQLRNAMPDWECLYQLYEETANQSDWI